MEYFTFGLVFWGLLRVVVVGCFCFIDLFTVKCFNFTSHQEKRLQSNLHLTTIIYSYCENNSPSVKTQIVESITFSTGRKLFMVQAICSYAAGTPFLRCTLKTESHSFQGGWRSLSSFSI